MAEEKWLLDGPKVIDLGVIRNLKVALIRGQVDIVGHDEPTTRVEVHSVSGRGLRIAVEGDSLEIDHPQLRWDNFLDVFQSFRGSARADVSVLVPRDVALKFGVVSSNGLISGLNSDAMISTVNGDLVIEGVTGDITLNSVSGDISVQDHTGRISAHTVNGDITASGAIGRFIADGVNSTLFLDIKGSPDEIRINTVNGAITTRLEDGNGADYSITTVNGHIQLDNQNLRGIRGNYNSRYGTLEGSYLEFRAKTVNGDVSVVHTPAEKPKARAAGKGSRS